MNIVIGNWKMNPATVAEAKKLAASVENGLMGVDKGRVRVVICPPFVFLPALKHSLHFAALGAQDVAHEEEGAFTGEVSAAQLKEFGVKYVIIGHSERRALGESNELIAKKLNIAFVHKLNIILCVGFGAHKGASAEEVRAILQKQLAAIPQGVELIVAYEPVWAIGTGQPAAAAHAREMLQFIESVVPGAQPIYGGSVDRHNAREFAGVGVSGALVGGASLKSDDFLEIIKAFAA
ncbi:MAG: triose-phosphate isomerase [Candidatus Doudnabacteria bacterium]|nr:triose-phosphate isomerase [Candidatus Doudnabacteria bacterium]